MGYDMWCMESNFRILKENQEKALEAIKELAGKETITGPWDSHFSWVHTKDFLEARHVENALDAWRWTAEFDEHGDISGIDFDGEKLGDESVLFNAIAPFVVEGSYIQMGGEDQYSWRWVFVDNRCVEIPGKTTYNMPQSSTGSANK